MRFTDLMSLPFDKNTGLILAGPLREALPTTPDDVLEQVYIDHGRKDEFQRLYGHLILEGIDWHLESVEASELSQASYNPGYRNFFEGVRQRVNKFQNKQWSCVDKRPTIRQHWEQHRTWLRPPVLIHGRLIGSTSAIHVVEGHTRVALLRGLVAEEVIHVNSTHQVWMGR